MNRTHFSFAAAGLFLTVRAAHQAGLDLGALTPAPGTGAAALAGVAASGAYELAKTLVTDLWKTWAKSPPEDLGKLFANGHLTQLIGEAIHGVLTRERDGSEGQFRVQLDRLLPHVVGYWKEHWIELTDGSLAAAHADQITAVLHRQIQDEEDFPIATAEAWDGFLRSFSQAQGAGLEDQARRSAADRLHRELAHAIYEKAKRAAKSDPGTWAAIQLQFQSWILQGVADLHEAVRAGFADQTAKLARRHSELLLELAALDEVKSIVTESHLILVKLYGATGEMKQLLQAVLAIVSRLQLGPSENTLRPSLGDLLVRNARARDEEEFEFARLMDTLLQSEARLQGCRMLGSRGLGSSTNGFTTYVTEGKFCGLEPTISISVSWSRNEHADFGDMGTHSDFRDVAALRSGKVKNWVFITPQKRGSKQWLDLLGILKERGATGHNFTQPEFEPWLRRCPALLARYYPQEAAKRSDAQGFDGREFEGWRREFSAKVLADHRALQLFGFPRSRRYTANPEQVIDPTSFLLEQVFIPQKLVPRGETEAAARTAGQLITGEECPVLLGDPGAGKTSLLRYLALACGEGKEVGGVRCPRRVPLFLPLREFARHRAERPTLLAALAHHARVSVSLSAEAVHPWHLEGLLLMGEAMVFFDGLDEAGDPAGRRDIARFIRQFRQDYPACPVWVTSRIAGYDQAALDKEVFPHFEVTAFDPGQQASFVRQWYLAKLPQAEAATKRDDKTKAFLQSLDRAVPEIKELAGNPLLLTLAIWVHDELGLLPTGRGQLYDQCVEIIVGKRDAERFDGEKIALEKLEPPLKPDNLRRYYTHIALKAQELNAGKAKEERGIIPKADLLGWIKMLRLPELRRFHNAADGYEKAAEAQAQAILDHSEERCGLLRYRGADTYAFLHLTFQEHLAAERKAAVLTGKHAELAEFIVSYAERDAWRETLLLLLYHLRKEMVRGMAEDEPETPFSDWLIARLQAAGQSAPAPACQRLLGMALRDGIEFTPAHRRWILELLFQDWRTRPEFDTETFQVLVQVAGFSPESRPMLLGLLQEGWQQEAGIKAFLALHLRVRLLGWPAESAEAGRLAGELAARLGGPGSPLPTDRTETRAARLLGAGRDEGRAGEPPALALMQRAADLLADAGPDVVSATVEGAESMAQVRGQFQTLMWCPRIDVHARVDAGISLARLGDLRLGVGCHAATGAAPQLPDIEFVDVVGGEFVMGSGLGEGRGDQRPKMLRCLLLPNAFKLSRYPVTAAQFETFVAAGGYGALKGPKPVWWTDKGWEWRVDETIERPVDFDAVFQTPNHPRIGVSWYEVGAFCRWLHEHRVALNVPADWHIRLPWEAEWERAARGCCGRSFPWEQEGPEDRCNFNGIIGHTTAVGLFPAGDAIEGTGRISDLVGNVREWCSTKWRENYLKYERSVDNQADGEAYRVVRGRAWLDDMDDWCASYREGLHPERRGNLLGFRVAASPFL